VWAAESSTVPIEDAARMDHWLTPSVDRQPVLLLEVGNRRRGFGSDRRSARGWRAG
jgi:hypothetical protein